MKNNVAYIERQNSLFFRVVAALCFTVTIGLIVYFLTTAKFSWEKRYFYAHFDLLQIVFILVFLGVYCSYTINCHFDFEKKLFKREFTIGIFKYGKWKPLPQIDYISLYATGPNVFQVNLWNNKNKHWDLYEEFNYRDAFKIAFELSELLDIDLLDATTRYNFRWIDKKNTKEKGEIVYLD